MPVKNVVLILMMCSFLLAIYATDPEVSNVTAAQRTDGSKIVDIWYDLTFSGTDNVDVVLEISGDAGSTFTIIPSPDNLSGDIGEGILPGAGKHIVWNAGAEAEIFDATDYMFKVTADYSSIFIFVEGGTFNNGTSDVTISSFYIDKYELTQAGYEAVMGVNPSYFAGNPNRPVEQVSWFNAIEYCNRRSMQEGLTPAYSYSTYGTDPSNWPSGWNTIAANHTNVSCNWSANGYRLPTEMEWMFAAKGGNQSQGYTYSGSNDINAVAWYSSNSFNTTHAVGTKAANELGTFDMSGNVWEWVWDIYGSYPGGSQTDPHGATSGSYRVWRGGSWYSHADGCTVSYRTTTYATVSNGSVGFRCVRVFP